MVLDDTGLGTLAGLFRVRHAIDDEIAQLIGDTPTPGHIGEVVAAAIFDIELESSGVNPGFDGHFTTGRLAGQTVNVKAYSERGGLLDISPHPCGWYLVLMGPPRATADKGRSLPFRIDRVFLSEIERLKAKLRGEGKGMGIATSVRKEDWKAALIFPDPASRTPLVPTERQRRLLALLSQHPGSAS